MSKSKEIDPDHEYRLHKAFAYSALINEVLSERIHGDHPGPGHQTSVNEGIVYLSFHIEDLLRDYILAEFGDDHHEPES